MRSYGIGRYESHQRYPLSSFYQKIAHVSQKHRQDLELTAKPRIDGKKENK